MKENYQIILNKTIENITKTGLLPSLLIHSCCAPCSSYVLEYLSDFFEITILYYNPNISPEEEFLRRKDEQIKLIEKMNFKNPVKFIDGGYNTNDFSEIARLRVNQKEGEEACFMCYRLRLSETVRIAKKNGFDYFTTTLSISPHKNAQILNEIGKELSEIYGINYLFSDFKKKGGYKRSCELSEIYDLYRQDYCGCVFSKKEAEERNNKKF